MTEQQVQLKQKLLAECIKMQKAVVENAKKTVSDFQASALEGDDGNEEKLYNSYREEMQNQRDMFARHYELALEELGLLNKVLPTSEYKEASFGTVVITEQQNFFVCISLGAVQVEGKTYFAISPVAPIFKAFSGKKAGEFFTFRDKQVKILEVF
jgi:hypothetical protein